MASYRVQWGSIIEQTRHLACGQSSLGQSWSSSRHGDAYIFISKIERVRCFSPDLHGFCVVGALARPPDLSSGDAVALLLLHQNVKRKKTIRCIRKNFYRMGVVESWVLYWTFHRMKTLMRIRLTWITRHFFCQLPQNQLSTSAQWRHAGWTIETSNGPESQCRTVAKGFLHWENNFGSVSLEVNGVLSQVRPQQWWYHRSQRFLPVQMQVNLKLKEEWKRKISMDDTGTWNAGCYGPKPGSTTRYSQPILR